MNPADIDTLDFVQTAGQNPGTGTLYHKDGPLYTTRRDKTGISFFETKERLQSGFNPGELKPLNTERDPLEDMRDRIDCNHPFATVLRSITHDRFEPIKVVFGGGVVDDLLLFDMFLTGNRYGPDIPRPEFPPRITIDDARKMSTEEYEFVWKVGSTDVMEVSRISRHCSCGLTLCS
jgi:hypothetical protein